MSESDRRREFLPESMMRPNVRIGDFAHRFNVSAETLLIDPGKSGRKDTAPAAALKGLAPIVSDLRPTGDLSTRPGGGEVDILAAG